jgi:integral membrane protein (TIGR01906 family)
LKFLKINARWIFVLSIPLFCLTFAIEQEFSIPWFYNYGFHKHGVSQSTGLTEDELAKVANQFTDYFNNSQEKIRIMIYDWDLPMFNENEVLHFQDVKGLVILDRRIMLGSLCVLLLGIIWWQRQNWAALGRSLIAGGVLTASILLLLVLGVSINFDWLFLQFHLLSFSNNYWYSRGYMTMLFPQGFWYDMAFFTILLTIAGAVLFGVLGYGVIKLARRFNKE